MARMIDVNSPEYMATLSVEQLRTLADSKRPEHIAPGFAAQLELVKRGAL